MSDGSQEEVAQAADAAQRRAELALVAAGLGEYEWDVARDRMIISARAAALTGLPEGEVEGLGGALITRDIHPEDLEATLAAGREGIQDHDSYRVQYRRIRPDDGRMIWMEGSAFILRDAAGAPSKVYGVLQDITERKAAESQRETFVAELDHRVKNVLASVQSLAAQTARKTASLEAFLKDFAGRLDAMASAHTLLTATRWRGADIGHIAAAELGGLASGQARWEGPEVILNPRATNSLTLALHELATNAMKFGSLSVEGGRVEVRWARREGGGFELVWTEKGGPSVPLPTHRGFGTTLFERVTGRELGGSALIEYRPDGVRATLIGDVTALVKETADAALAPVSQARTAPAPDDRVGGASLGVGKTGGIKGLKVLIVEDSMLLAVELEAGLTEVGAIVIGTAVDVKEGLALAGAAIDVAVLDANLNGESVTPVAHVLAERGIPFIFATGYGDAAPAPEGFDAPVVRKPYNVHQIAAALAEAMGRT